MPAFLAGDGTELAYRVQGDGPPLVCVPGGPMRDSVYLGDLGGLSASRRLIMLDLRGTGRSAKPADPASYRCDRLVDDVAALRDHLGLDRMDLLGHSAGANVAAMYAARHPGQVSKLTLVAPSAAGVFAGPGAFDPETTRAALSTFTQTLATAAEGAAHYGTFIGAAVHLAGSGSSLG